MRMACTPVACRLVQLACKLHASCVLVACKLRTGCPRLAWQLHRGRLQAERPPDHFIIVHGCCIASKFCGHCGHLAMASGAPAPPAMAFATRYPSSTCTTCCATPYRSRNRNRRFACCHCRGRHPGSCWHCRACRRNWRRFAGCRRSCGFGCLRGALLRT